MYNDVRRALRTLSDEREMNRMSNQGVTSTVASQTTPTAAPAAAPRPKPTATAAATHRVARTNATPTQSALPDTSWLQQGSGVMERFSPNNTRAKGAALAHFLNRHLAPGEKPIGEDGGFGPQMQDAVRKYQAAHGLKVDGSVDFATRKIMQGDALQDAHNDYDKAGNNFMQTLQTNMGAKEPNGQPTPTAAALQGIRSQVQAEAAAAKRAGKPYDAVTQMRDRALSWAMAEGKKNPGDSAALGIATSATNFKTAELNLLRTSSAVSPEGPAPPASPTAPPEGAAQPESHGFLYNLFHGNFSAL